MRPCRWWITLQGLSKKKKVASLTLFPLYVFWPSRFPSSYHAGPLILEPVQKSEWSPFPWDDNSQKASSIRIASFQDLPICGVRYNKGCFRNYYKPDLLKSTADPYLSPITTWHSLLSLFLTLLCDTWALYWENISITKWSSLQLYIEKRWKYKIA